jgi:hypothetical protein
MPTRYGPSIVQDSIEFHIDAANVKCYNPRENLILFSQGGFNNTTYWPKVSTTGYTLTDNTTETAAPDGTFTATKINCTAPAQDGSSSFAQDIAMPLGVGTYTLSVYLKGSTATGIRFQGFGLFNTIDGFVGANINPIAGTVSGFGGNTVVVTDVGNGWRRYSLTAKANNINNGTFKYQIYLDASAGVTYMWGAQIERTSSPGAYVATTTSQVVKPLPCNNISNVLSIDTINNNNRVMYDSRNNGSFTFDGLANFERPSRTYNFPGGGTVDVWFRFNSISGSQGVFYISDGGTNLVNFWYNGSKLRWEIVRAGAATQIVTNTTILANTWYHAVGVWDSTSTYVYLNGVLEASTTSSNRPTAITGGTAIGTYSSSMDGNISSVKVYNRPLTAAQVAQNFNALRGRYSL